MKKIKVGDLVFLPSDAMLLRPTGLGFCKTHVPSHVLVLEVESNPGHHTVLYRGEKWSAYCKDLYPIVEKEVINNGN
tara:strand:+ start:1559 stop:1789 length:231 start_codon:yes stop_codon:yes gene_type:complete